MISYKLVKLRGVANHRWIPFGFVSGTLSRAAINPKAKDLQHGRGC
jgi:hypothetical protein